MIDLLLCIHKYLGCINDPVTFVAKTKRNDLVFGFTCFFAEPKGEIGAPCLFGWSCSDRNAVCENGRCRCKVTSFERNGMCGEYMTAPPGMYQYISIVTTSICGI